ncbi:chemotaxis protein CheW [Actinoplanes sp. CA-030573]|uniref:chemotaxis protein CheW n=1 Tax=Actinoplanes sp. CA-030573 TaxID=3239898 RepID=UPI003D8BC7D7
MAALVFRAGPLLCALRLDEVIETMRPLEIQPLAGTPAFVLGISVLRGVPTPVIDVARLLGGSGPSGGNGPSSGNGASGGNGAKPRRYIAVRTERGAVALAVGPVIGIRNVDASATGGHPALLGTRSSRLVAGVGTVGSEPLLLLQSMRAVPDEVWEAAAGVGAP